MSSLPYRVVLAEAATGIVLNGDGSWHLSSQGPCWQPTFDSLDEALALKDVLLERFPSAEVHIMDGPDGFKPLRFTPKGKGPQ